MLTLAQLIVIGAGSPSGWWLRAPLTLRTPLLLQGGCSGFLLRGRLGPLPWWHSDPGC